ncbi:MAG: anaerobic sulfatase-maturation protein [Bacteroidales bacterium]
MNNSKPLYVMVKPVGAECNLRCKYCYYLEKSYMYNKRKLSDYLMSEELLERFIIQYIDAQPTPEIVFTWHGGEPLLHKLDFYKKAIELQKKYGNGKKIENVLQTNGTLITDEWCKFFKRNNFLIGVSIDGAKTMHNINRHNMGGGSTFDQVMRGVNLLNKHKVDWNAMATVNSYNADYPKEFYAFFKSINCQYLQFTPVVERILQHKDGRHLASAAEQLNESQIAPFTVSAKQWGNFLCEVYDEWVKEDVGKVFVQIFDSTLANWVGAPPSVCTMCKDCGHALVMEHNGDLYSCDHYVFPEYKLGNIDTQFIKKMANSDRQGRFSTAKSGMLPRECRECEYLFACNGGCPKDRFIKTSELGNNKSFLCEGYHKFFHHVAEDMDFMKNELLNNRPPANVMQWIKTKG